MPSNFTDKLLKTFISGSSNPSSEYDAFADLQDPTFLSFKLDFFPDLGYSMPDDAYSSGGLFRSPGLNSIDNYSFYDSAADYLARIGAPARQHYLEIFISLLYEIQDKAPWYFQSVTGAGDLYKIDPAINYRGKDKILTIECLESIDLRVSLLADLYRNIAFDMQGMREVLPVNLRTFNMNLHILEFRKFNTTFGKIADSIAKSQRTVSGQRAQTNNEDAKRRNVFNQGSSSLFRGTFDTINTAVSNFNSKTGGLFANLGEEAGSDYMADLKSAFEAISVQSFILKDCEFDFFSESPGYLDILSVKDIPEATHRFKIKVGKIQKLATYSFDNYVIAEYAKYSKINPNQIKFNSGLSRKLVTSPHYFEETTFDSVDNPETFYRDYRESIFPSEGRSARTTARAYAKAQEESEFLRRKPLERILGSVIRNASSAINQEINQGLGKISGGVIGTPPLGNVYGKASFIRRATEALNGFLTPGTQITTDRTSNRPPNEVLQKITFDSLNIENTIDGRNVGFNSPSPEELSTKNIYDNVSVPNEELVSKNIFAGQPSSSPDDIGNSNVYAGVPPLPTGEIGDRNVYE